MYILGVNFSSHDTSACLVKDGKLIEFIEEERLSRVKHTSEFPSRSIDALINKEGISLSQIDYIAVPTTHSIPILILLKYSLSFGLGSFIPIILGHLKYRLKFQRTLRKFKNKIGKGNTKFIFVEHHTSHVANAFLPSPFDKAAILSVDNEGDGLSSRLAYGEGNKINYIKSLELKRSIGLLYYLVTHHLGFSEESGEGKVMGLSSYGNPDRYIDVFRDIVRLEDGGLFSLNGKYLAIKPGLSNGAPVLSDYFIKQVGSPRKKGDPLRKEHEDIAAGLQKITEETVFHVLNYLYRKTKCSNLVLGGGVALNSVMNGKLHRQTPFKNIFIQPLSYDGGNAVGAALYVWNVILGNPRTYKLESAYLGPEFSDEDIKKALDSSKLKYEKLEDSSMTAAKLISEGKIIGWFQGRMEAGARALGNRSILADPRSADMKDTVNAMVKHREPFRPFAPAILQEKVGEYFEEKMPVLFMEKVFPVRKEKQKLIPAVVHVDGTGRLQTVTRDSNRKYYDKIKNFENITGIPVILNTSFNIRGEPIVCSPFDAIKCFYSTGLDNLIVGDYLLSK